MLLNTPVLDVALGILFSLLAVSLVSSAVVEAINSLLKLRSKSLRAGVQQLLNDPQFGGLAKSLYEHALVNPRGPGGTDPRGRSPAYIDSKMFAKALLDVTGMTPAAVRAASGLSTVEALTKAVDSIADPQIKAFLKGAVDRTQGDIDAIQKEIGDWFDTAMDRVSGAFKRWTQLASFVIALVFAVGVNVDAVKVAGALWEQPNLARKLTLPPDVQAYLARVGTGTPAPPAAGAAQPAEAPGDRRTVGAEERSSGADEMAATPGGGQGDASGRGTPPVLGGEAVRLTFAQLEENLPVGWESGRPLYVRAQAADGTPVDRWLFDDPRWPAMVAGWLVTAFATLLGAPFWFDLLQTVIRIKGAGPSPREKVEDRGAAA